ncbi:hypothetical protein [Streptomyces griseoruber]|uniref:hypothetical protein n=1 Tax=Streptomyces griseoruber TaxID=1943 RepID=UPI003792F5B2
MTGTASQLNPSAEGAQVVMSSAPLDLLPTPNGTAVDLPGMTFTTTSAGMYQVVAVVRGRVVCNNVGGAWVTGVLVRGDTGAVIGRTMAAHASVPGAAGSVRADSPGTVTWAGQLPAGVTVKAQAFRQGAPSTECGVLSDGNGFTHLSWTRIG